MKIILIAGKARSGKTETSKILKQELETIGYKVAITEYSKYIKLFAKELIGWNGEEPKPRKFLQDFGSYVRHKSNNPNYFVNRMKEDILLYQNWVDFLIISDVRLKQEIEELNEYNPLTIKVMNDTNVYNLTEEESHHETELELDSYNNFDYIFQNKTIEEIHEEIKKLILEQKY